MRLALLLVAGSLPSCRPAQPPVEAYIGPSAPKTQQAAMRANPDAAKSVAAVLEELLEAKSNQAANRLAYDGKPVTVSGRMSTVEKTDGLYLLTMTDDGGFRSIVCELPLSDGPALSELRIGSPVQVRGIARSLVSGVGYMDHCQLVTSP